MNLKIDDTAKLEKFSKSTFKSMIYKNIFIEWK